MLENSAGKDEVPDFEQGLFFLSGPIVLATSFEEIL
jgi:hypothetical protein